jgi:hypothetical protein
MLAKKTSKNQITLPSEIVGSFPGIDLFDATVEGNRIVLTPVKVVPVTASPNEVRARMKKLGLAPQDVAEAVQWARK